MMVLYTESSEMKTVNFEAQTKQVSGLLGT